MEKMKKLSLLVAGMFALSVEMSTQKYIIPGAQVPAQSSNNGGHLTEHSSNYDVMYHVGDVNMYLSSELPEKLRSLDTMIGKDMKGVSTFLGDSDGLYNYLSEHYGEKLSEKGSKQISSELTSLRSNGLYGFSTRGNGKEIYVVTESILNSYNGLQGTFTPRQPSKNP